MSQPLKAILTNGFPIHADDTWRGIQMMLGTIKTPELPVVGTDNDVLLKALDTAGGFGIAVTRTVNPGFMAFQRGIEGMTRSYWGHAQFLIGEKVAAEARRRNPGMLRINRGPLGELIPPTPSLFEIVESQAMVAVSDFRSNIAKGEQAIAFVNPSWTFEQRVAMAICAYSWVGHLYDIFEIGKYVFPGLPNPHWLKVCSTLVAEIIAAADPSFDAWCVAHNIDPQMLPPRDIFAFASDRGFVPYSFGCSYQDALVPAE